MPAGARVLFADSGEHPSLDNPAWFFHSTVRGRETRIDFISGVLPGETREERQRSQVHAGADRGYCGAACRTYRTGGLGDRVVAADYFGGAAVCCGPGYALVCVS